MKKLILASASPRRKEILEKAGYEFEIVVSDKEGKIEKNADPKKIAVRFACRKAEDVFACTGGDAVVLGADTVVCLNGEILGKPANEEEATEMLKKLSGKEHEVVTGYCLISRNMRLSGHVLTKVKFAELDDEKIAEYVKSGLCMGKAGAYGIQDGYGLAERIEGDYDNVVGLPIAAIDPELKEFLK